MKIRRSGAWRDDLMMVLFGSILLIAIPGLVAIPFGSSGWFGTLGVVGLAAGAVILLWRAARSDRWRWIEVEGGHLLLKPLWGRRIVSIPADEVRAEPYSIPWGPEGLSLNLKDGRQFVLYDSEFDRLTEFAKALSSAKKESPA